jgi:hypothetical protein
VLPVVLLASSLGACGSTRGGAATSEASSKVSGAGSLLGDQDNDSGRDNYYDRDDGEVRDYGHAASAAETRAIGALVKAYYAAAAAGNGTRACQLTYYFEAETLPEQYAQPPGPRWLHGLSTCSALLTRVFAHFHASLSAPVLVTGVRVDGDRAEALVGFKTLPAGFLKARLEGGSWKIDSLLAAPLP